jgi:hypothetical protein
MDKIPRASLSRSEEPLPTDLLASLLMERSNSPSPATSGPSGLPLKVYGVMAVTTLLTFATLTTGYQLLFSNPLFA